MLSLPNTGHVGANHDPRLIPTANAFIQRVAQGKPMPTVESSCHPTPQGSRLVITTKDAAVSARVWIAQLPTRDFRSAQWESQSVPLMSATPDSKSNLTRRAYQIKLPRPSSGYQAIIAELEFAYLPQRFWLSTIPYVLKSQ